MLTSHVCPEKVRGLKFLVGRIAQTYFAFLPPTRSRISPRPRIMMIPATVSKLSSPENSYSAFDDDCQCNPVSYALFQACQTCQYDNGTVILTYVPADSSTSKAI